MLRPSAELIPAYVWTCDICGSDNFGRMIRLEMESISPDNFPDHLDRDAILEWIESGGDGDFLTVPGQVTCQSCGEIFLAEPL